MTTNQTPVTADIVEPTTALRDALAPHLAHFTLFHLQVDALRRALSAGEPVVLRIADRELELTLEPHAIWDGDLADSVETARELERIGIYRGHLTHQPESSVQLVIAPGFLQGRIATPGETTFFEPAASFSESLDDSLLVLYRDSDLISSPNPTEPSCGNPTEVSPVPNTPPTEAMNPTFTVPIAIEADFEFWNRNQSNWSAKILGVLNEVSAVFESHHGLRLVVTHLAVHKSASAQPYKSTKDTTLLGQLRAYGGQITAERALTHLFSGKELDGNIAGIADTGTVCKTPTYGLSALPFGSQNGLVALVSHELGHNFGALHVGTEHCQGPDAIIMCPSFGTKRIFLAPNISRIAAHVNAHSGCLWSGDFSRGRALHPNAKSRQTPVAFDFHGTPNLDPPSPESMVLWTAEHARGGIYFSSRHQGETWKAPEIVGGGDWRNYLTYLYSAALPDKLSDNEGLQLVWRGYEWNQPEIYGARGTWSQMKGWTWSKHSEIQGNATPESPALSRFYGIKTGRILLWVEDEDKRRLCYKTSEDGGISWGTPQRIGDAYASEKTPAAIPVGTQLLVFGNSKSATRELWYTSWNTQTWQAPKTIPGASSDFSPAVTELNGEVFVAWKERGDGSRILYSRSSSPFESWSQPAPINGDPHHAACAPALANLGGQVRIFWINANDHHRIYHARLL
ncbi:MAG: M12 family metallo-peptidase [Acidobacteriota bacterium]